MRTKPLSNRPVVPIDFRVKKALKEKRFAEAVQLALDLPDQPELLFEAVQGRVTAWLASGQTVFAADLLRKVTQRLSSDPKRAQWLAVKLAWCGAVPEALMIAPDAEPVRAAACDASIERGDAGLSILPDEMQPAHSAIIRAFAAFQDGQDDAAREALNQIGLGSLFLEWKLLLRGLMAWHANDDAKAIDNWQRLDSERLPAKLAATFRGNIDPAWLHLQPAEWQAKTRKQSDRLLAGPLTAELRRLQREIETEPPIASIRRAKSMLQLLKDQCPDAVPLVVEALSLAVMTKGTIHDVAQMAKSLPAPKEDPTFDWLRALGAEHAHDLESSRKCWLDYEKALRSNPDIFGAETTRVRAMIHWHVAQQGKMLKDAMEIGPRVGLPVKPVVKPTIKQSEAEALKLAPDLRVALLSALITTVDSSKTIEPIVKAGERLLKQYPDDDEGLRILTLTCERLHYPVEQFKYAKMLLDLKPLDQGARHDAAGAARMAARMRGSCKDWQGAREFAEEAGKIDGDPNANVSFLATVDFAAGNSSAIDDFLASVKVEYRGLFATQVFAAACSMRCELGLKNTLVPMITQAINGPMSLEYIRYFAATYASMADDRIDYPGRKTHAAKLGKKIVTLAKENTATADELADVLGMALEAELFNDVILACTPLRRRFPNDPRFSFFVAKARFERDTDADDRAMFSILRETECKLNDLPPDQRLVGMTEDVAEMQRELSQIDGSPFGSMFRDILEELGGGFR